MIIMLMNVWVCGGFWFVFYFKDIFSLNMICFTGGIVLVSMWI